ISSRTSHMASLLTQNRAATPGVLAESQEMYGSSGQGWRSERPWKALCPTGTMLQRHMAHVQQDGKVTATGQQLCMVMAAVYCLALVRDSWARDPAMTWGIFLERMQEILEHSLPPKMATAEWQTLSQWCAAQPDASLCAMADAALNVYISPSPKHVVELAVILDHLK
ncbi:unnamed protein product, partial [Effrenium voratum]